VPLDRHAELGWRIRLEGSLGLPEREFAGPVVGLQQIYREGLAHLDAQARSRYGVAFADAPTQAQDALLADPQDAGTQAFVPVAFANSLEAMYGPPEYGGNRGLAGWGYTRWPGDVQPRGYRDDEVTGPEPAPAAAAAAGTPLPAIPPAGLERASRDEFWLGRQGMLRGR
jgi:hypothetical protein